MAEPKHIDTLIRARWLYPVVPAKKVFEHCSVAIDKGQILAILPNDHAADQYHPRELVDLPEHIVMPGLVNAHGHAAMTLLRGYADDLPLQTWLERHIWPAESKWVCPEFVADGATLAIAEMLASGTTCFSDMYFFPEECARVAFEMGIRAQMAFPVLDFPTNWGADADDYIHKGLMLADTYRSNALVNIGFGPHAPYTVSDAALTRIAVLADEMQAPIQIHLHETSQEVADAMRTTGKRPIRRLMDLGLLTPATQCVHMTQINEDDIALLSQSGASVIHCPTSNYKLASGVCPTPRLLAAGVPLGLGTDGAASNNSVNLWGDITLAALSAKISADDARALSAHDTLFAATLGGAKALGLGDKVGSLEPGKQADLTALSVNDLGATPLYDVASHLVYNNRNLTTTHTWVNGRALFREGRFTQLDVGVVRAKARHWQHQIQAHTKG